MQCEEFPHKTSKIRIFNKEFDNFKCEFKIEILLIQTNSEVGVGVGKPF